MTGREVAKGAGGSGSNINHMGHWADKTLKEIAEGVRDNASGAKKALKIIKEAGRLSQKH